MMLNIFWHQSFFFPLVAQIIWIFDFFENHRLQSSVPLVLFYNLSSLFWCSSDHKIFSFIFLLVGCFLCHLQHTSDSICQKLHLKCYGLQFTVLPFGSFLFRIGFLVWDGPPISSPPVSASCMLGYPGTHHYACFLSSLCLAVLIFYL